MTLRTFCFSSILLIAVAAQAAAQSSSSYSTSDPDAARAGLYVTVGAGGTKDLDTKGGAVTLGAAVKVGPILASVTGMDLLLSSGDTYPYYWDAYYSICRNQKTGEFAERDACDSINTKYAFSADVQALLPGTPLALGVGHRFGPDKHNTFFGSAGIYWESPSRRIVLTAKANVGKDYLSGLFTLAARVTR